MPHIHDMHCHVDLYPDFQEVIDESEQQCIYTLAVTNTPSVFPRCAELLKGRRFIRPAVGLHPELAVQRRGELSRIPDLLHETRYVGEVGLDFLTQDTDERRVQKEVFAAILDMAAGCGDRVLTVHSRRAAAEVVAMIGPNYPGTVILHWYSGSLSVLAEAIQCGHYFSVNPAMITSKAGRKIVQMIPREHILLETDGPFVQVGGIPARPRDVRMIVSALAALWQEEVARVHVRLKQNLAAALGGIGDTTQGLSPDRETNPIKTV